MEENMREALETIRAQMHRLVDERIDDAAARMESGEIDYEPVRAHPLDWRPAAFCSYPPPASHPCGESQQG